MTKGTKERVVQLNRGVETTSGLIVGRGPEHDALAGWVGRWINRGHVINADGSAGLEITTSDVYEWVPGGHFLMHTAYGRMGDFGGGGVEIIGFDEKRGEYTSHLFDSLGNVAISRLVATGNTWVYHGETTRSTVHFSEDHHVQTVLHERTDDGITYTPSMRVTLVKVD